MEQTDNLIQNEQFIQRLDDFLNKTQDFTHQFYQKLTVADKKQESIMLRKLFFNQKQSFLNQQQLQQIEIQNQNLSNEEYLKDLNNGMIYTFIFDYAGSSQEFEQFSILRTAESHKNTKNTLKDIYDFIYYPQDDIKYNQIKNKMLWNGHLRVRITDDSSMAVCLNDALLYEDWQIKFQQNMLQWNQNSLFSPGRSIGLGGNIAQSLATISNIWRMNKQTVWIFQLNLNAFKTGQSTKLFSDGSGNGALIRSAGMFQFYITLYINFLKQKNITSEQQKLFDERIIYLYMMDQHDQSSLTHSGLQAQVCILLLGYIQINLLMKQLKQQYQQSKQNQQPLEQEIKNLMNSFINIHLEKILNAYSNEKNIDLTQLNNDIRQREQKIKNNNKVWWQRYLNVNTFLKENNINDQIYKSILLFYYELFYKNENGEFMWEDRNFIDYVSLKRQYMREGVNEDINKPQCNSETSKIYCNNKKYYNENEYSQYLDQASTGYFASYSPDCMALIFYLIVQKKEQNINIFDYLFQICLYKGDCDSYGAVLATVLAAYDLNYHKNINNNHNNNNNNNNNAKPNNNNNFMSHLNRQELHKNQFISQLKSQVILQDMQLIQYKQ